MDDDMIAACRQAPRLVHHALRILVGQKDKGDAGHGSKVFKVLRQEKARVLAPFPVSVCKRL